MFHDEWTEMLDLSELQSRYVLGGLEKARFINNVRGQFGNLIFCLLGKYISHYIDDRRLNMLVNPCIHDVARASY
jgi:hypothetical protein